MKLFLIGLWGLMILLVTDSAFPAQTREGWRTVEIRAEEHRFMPDLVRAKTGVPLMIVVVNEGHEPHQFRSSVFKGRMVEVEIRETVVRGSGIDLIDVAAGETTIIKLLSPPTGEFVFECRIPSHHGMDGILMIEE